MIAKGVSLFAEVGYDFNLNRQPNESFGSPAASFGVRMYPGLLFKKKRKEPIPY